MPSDFEAERDAILAAFRTLTRDQQRVFTRHLAVYAQLSPEDRDRLLEPMLARAKADLLAVAPKVQA